MKVSPVIEFARGDRPGEPDPFTLSKPLDGVRLVLLNDIPVGAVGRDARHSCWIVRTGHAPVLTADGWLMRCGNPAVTPSDWCATRWEALHVFAIRLAGAVLGAFGLPVDAATSRDAWNRTCGFDR